MKKSHKASVILIVLVLAAGILWLLQWSGLVIIIPKIQGTLTIHQDYGSQVYRFSAAGGDYGEYCWTVGPDELPVSIDLFSRNCHFVIDMSFDIERLDTQWQVTGIVSVKNHEPVFYLDNIPLEQPLRISVDCFP